MAPFPKTLKDLCTPASLYFIISMIGLVIVMFQNLTNSNSYNNDVSRQMVDVGANRPFLKGGRRKKSIKQRGGTLSNFIGQDLINLGRQFHFGIGSAYNALAGYSAPVNPMPWRDQFPSKIPLNATTI